MNDKRNRPQATYRAPRSNLSGSERTVPREKSATIWPSYCRKPHHHSFNGNVATHREAHHIFADMMPGHKADGPCEMRIFESKWRDYKNFVPTSIYVPFGSYEKGIVGLREGADDIKEVYHLRYSMTTKEYKFVTEQFPRYKFIPGTENHDHPVAHTLTAINSHLLMQKLKEGTKDAPKCYLDMHGNPASNAKFNRYHDTIHVDTVVERVTPKDYERAADKWGDWESQLGDTVFEHTDRDWMMDDGAADELKARTRDYAGYVSIHTLYYYQKDYLANLLARKKGSVLHALVHRFPKDSGKLNCDEQEYRKFYSHNQKHVIQENALTSEKYSHPDIEWLFERSSWCETGAHGSDFGLAWTINKASEGTYYVKMTHCPASAVLMELVKPKPMTVRDRDSDILGMDGVVEVKVGTSVVPIPVEAQVSYSQMRMHVSGKARTAEQFKDHLAATKRAMKKNGEDGDSPNNVALASFLKDFEADRDVTQAAFGANLESAKMYSTMLAGHAPLSCRNLLDKALCLGVVINTLVHNKSTEKNAAGTLRIMRELLQSNGTTVQV